ncbi:MAG TPA: type II toxin-antitoxin system VapB family antitoxin [Caulobacteraceae bacterium]|nr:type II toxin-antitoxin system VapB family antitoxin [Caulobacteraceae bacterium]
MAILIKNPQAEKRLRELAALRGESLTRTVERLAEEGLAEEARKRRRPTVAEMKAATEVFRRKVGLDQPHPPITKADFDALWEIPGLAEDGET